MVEPRDGPPSSAADATPVTTEPDHPDTQTEPARLSPDVWVDGCVVPPASPYGDPLFAVEYRLAGPDRHRATVRLPKTPGPPLPERLRRTLEAAVGAVTSFRVLGRPPPNSRMTMTTMRKPDAPDVFRAAAAAGVRLTLNEDRIELDADHQPPDDLLAAISAVKPHLIEILRGDRCR